MIYSKERLAKLVGVLCFLQLSSGFLIGKPSGSAVRNEVGTILNMAGEDEGKPLTGYAKRRLSTKVTFGARDLPKENAISDMENIEEMPEKIELDPQATPVMKAPGTIKKPSSPPPAPVSGDDAKQFTGPTGYDARRLSTSLKFQGKERPKENAIADVENPEDVDQALTEVVMGGMRMFLPQAQADAMVASGSASLPGSEPEPVVEEVKAEPVAAVKKEPVAAAKAEPVAAAKEEPAAELMEVFMGGVAMMLPTAQAQALLASGGAQKSGAAAPAPAPVPDPVAAAPAPVAAAPAPAPAPVESDELMEVSMGGSSMMLPKAQAQAMLASGAAQEPGAAAPAPAPAPVPAPVAAAPAPAPAPAARAPAPAAAAASATPSDSLMEVFLGSKGIMVPVAEATAMLAAGAVTAQAPVPVVEEPLKLKMVNVAGRDLMLPMDQAMEMLANGSARPIAAERAPKDEGTVYSLVEVNVDGSNIMVPDNVVDAMCAAGVAKRTAPKPVASLPVASAPKAPAAAAASEELVEVLINGQSVFVPATQAGSLVAFGAAQRADSVPKPPAPAPAPAPVAAAPAPVSDPDALVEVNMNGMNMFLPAGQAEQMISMGMASRV